MCYVSNQERKDVDRLYIPCKEGGGGLMSIEDCVELALRGFWKLSEH